MPGQSCAGERGRARGATRRPARPNRSRGAHEEAARRAAACPRGARGAAGCASVHDVQPVVEVLAEVAARATAVAEVAVGRRDHAHVEPASLVGPPTRLDLALLRARAGASTWIAGGQLADLVEEERAAARPARSGPTRRASAPVKAPRSWPKSSLSSSVSGSAPQLSATKRPRAPPARSRGARAPPPPCRCRSRRGRARRRRRRATCRMVSRRRRIAGASPTSGRSALRLGGLAQPAVLADQPPLLGGVRDRGRQPLAVEGLGDEVVGPVLDRRDREVDVGVAGDEQHRELRVDRLHPLEELQPGHPRHADVGDDRALEVCVDRRERRLGAVERLHLEARELQHLRRRPAQVGVVVDEDDGRGHARPRQLEREGGARALVRLEPRARRRTRARGRPR